MKITPKKLTSGVSIENSGLKLTFANFSSNESSLTFDLYNKVLNKTEKVDVGLAFWYSYMHYNKFTDNG